MAERKIVSLENLAAFAEELKRKYAKQTDYDNLSKKVQTLEEAHGEENKIEVVKVNGEALSVALEDKSVDIEVPRRVSELGNDIKFQTEDQVSAAIAARVSSLYTPGGSAGADKFANAPSEDEEGKVYNASEPFDTNEHFLESDSKHYPAGTNVEAVKTDDGTMKWDALAGFIDLSDYARTEDMDSAISAAIDDIDIGSYAKASDLELYIKSSDLKEITADEIKTLLA